MRVEKTFRGISRRIAVHYLEGLDGQPVTETGEAVADASEDAAAADRVARVEGDEWTATLSSDTASVGPMDLSEVTAVFEGEPGAVEAVVEAFSRKAMRAGG